MNINIGDLIIKIADFLGDFGDFIQKIINWEFSIGGLTVNFWTLLFSLGIITFITVLILKVIL